MKKFLKSRLTVFALIFAVLGLSPSVVKSQTVTVEVGNLCTPIWSSWSDGHGGWFGSYRCGMYAWIYHAAAGSTEWELIDEGPLWIA